MICLKDYKQNLGITFAALHQRNGITPKKVIGATEILLPSPISSDPTDLVCICLKFTHATRTCDYKKHVAMENIN